MKSKQQKKAPDTPPATPAAADRRRVGKVVRDDRDGATVEWVEPPADYERVPLSLESTLPSSGTTPGAGYDPYAAIPPHTGAPSVDKRPAKRDLRKLSEWIKKMRELEQRKKRGES